MYPRASTGPKFYSILRGLNQNTSTPVPFSLRRRGAGDEAIKSVFAAGDQFHPSSNDNRRVKESNNQETSLFCSTGSEVIIFSSRYAEFNISAIEV